MGLCVHSGCKIPYLPLPYLSPGNRYHSLFSSWHNTENLALLWSWIWDYLQLDLRWLLFVHPKTLCIHWHLPVCVHTHAYTDVHTHTQLTTDAKESSIFYVRWLFGCSMLMLFIYYSISASSSSFPSSLGSDQLPSLHFICPFFSPGPVDGFTCLKWGPNIPRTYLIFFLEHLMILATQTSILSTPQLGPTGQHSCWSFRPESLGPRKVLGDCTVCKILYLEGWYYPYK